MRAAARRWLLRLLTALGIGRSTADFTRELAAHLALLEEDFVRRGLSAADARIAARRAIGGVEQARGLHQDARSFAAVDDVRRDVRYAIRSLAHAPGFTALSVLTLALGVGATAGVFTLINAALWTPLPIRDQANLVLLGDAAASGIGNQQDGSITLYSVALYRHVQTLGIFDELLAVQSSKLDVGVRTAGEGTSQPAMARVVSPNYFAVLGVGAAMGRVFGSTDEGNGVPPVAVASHQYWKTRLRGDPSIVGKPITIDGLSVTLVGVAAEGFSGERLQADPPALWIPFSTDRQLEPQFSVVDAPDEYWLYLLGRLRPGVTLADARRRLTAGLHAYLRGRVGASGMTPQIEQEIAATFIEPQFGGIGSVKVRRRSSVLLSAALGLGALVWLISCANVSSLLLARATGRRGEYLVRLALGASRSRLIRQSLTESLTLALAGAVVGIALAGATARLLVALVFPGARFVPVDTSVNLTVLGFTLGMTCAAAIIFGLVPALRAGREAGPAGREVGRGLVSSGPLSSRGWGRFIVAAQVALAVVAITVAGAMIRTMSNLANQPLGFDRSHTLVFEIDPSRAGYSIDRLMPLYRELESRLGAIAGSRSVGISRYTPFRRCCWSNTISVNGHQAPAGEPDGALLNRVSSTFFEAMGTRVIAGRPIDARDTADSPRVAVVTRALAREYFGDADPIGQRFGIGGPSHQNDFTIVGVVEDARYDEPRDGPIPMAFFPFLQSYSGDDRANAYSNFARTVVLRTAADPASVVDEARRVFASIDPTLVLFAVSTLEDDVNRAVGGEAVAARLALAVGATALTLTIVGLYGLTAYGVRRRRRELALRLALGAGGAAIVGRVLADAGRQAAIGIIVGIPAGFVVRRLIGAALYGVETTAAGDAWIAGVLIAIAVALAAYLPARRATRINPLEALRAD